MKQDFKNSMNWSANISCDRQSHYQQYYVGSPVQQLVESSLLEFLSICWMDVPQTFQRLYYQYFSVSGIFFSEWKGWEWGYTYKGNVTLRSLLLSISSLEIEHFLEITETEWLETVKILTELACLQWQWLDKLSIRSTEFKWCLMPWDAGCDDLLTLMIQPTAETGDPI